MGRGKKFVFIVYSLYATVALCALILLVYEVHVSTSTDNGGFIENSRNKFFDRSPSTLTIIKHVETDSTMPAYVSGFGGRLVSSSQSSSDSGSATSTSSPAASTTSPTSPSLLYAQSTYYEHPITLYIDWNYDSASFSLLNYLTLERLLLIYPQAQVVFLLAAPIAANYYKWRNRLSKHQFQKYEKSGYHVSFRVISTNPFISGADGDISLGSVAVSAVAAAAAKSLYFHEWFQKCCGVGVGAGVGKSNSSSRSNSNLTIDSTGAILPFHFIMYTRIAQLYLTGGMFTDFNWFHLKPAVTVDLANDKHDFILLDQGSISSGSSFPSVLMYFMHPRSPILSCILLEYDTIDSLIHLCLATTVVSVSEDPGVDASFDCVLSLVTRCVRQQETDEMTVHQEGGSIRRFCLKVVNNYKYSRESPQLQLHCTSAAATETSNSDVPSILSVSAVSSSILLESYPAVSLWNLGAETTTAGYWKTTGHILDTLTSVPLPSLYLPTTATTGDHYTTATRFTATTTTAAATTTSTTATDTNSRQDVGIDDTMYDAMKADNIADEHRVMKHKVTSATTVDTDTIVSASASTGVAAAMADGFSHVDHNFSGVVGPICSPYFTPRATTDINVATNEPWMRSWSSEQLDRAANSCAPTFVVPGFMKAGTTFVYDVLTRHPQVLKALRGVVFKETGCYLDMNSVYKPDRMNCFPFVSRTDMFILKASAASRSVLVTSSTTVHPAGNLTIGRHVDSTASITTRAATATTTSRVSSPFAFGDGTVTYATRRHIPVQMHRDNPTMKVLFCVRNPIQRLLSQYRFMLPPAGASAERNHFFSLAGGDGIKGMTDSVNINTIMSTALATDSSVWILHQAAVELLGCSNSNSNMYAHSHTATDLSPRSDLLSNRCLQQRSRLINSYFYGSRSQFQPPTYRKSLQQQQQDQSQNQNQNQRQRQLEEYYFRCVHLLVHSVYIAPILHWDNVFGSDNLLVVSAELLQTQSQQQSSEALSQSSDQMPHPVHSYSTSAVLQRWNRIYHFLDISASNETSFLNVNAHATDRGGGGDQISKGKSKSKSKSKQKDNSKGATRKSALIQDALNATVSEQLALFFAPFDQLLRYYVDDTTVGVATTTVEGAATDTPVLNEKSMLL